MFKYPRNTSNAFPFANTVWLFFLWSWCSRWHSLIVPVKPVLPSFMIISDLLDEWLCQTIKDSQRMVCDCKVTRQARILLADLQVTTNATDISGHFFLLWKTAGVWRFSEVFLWISVICISLFRMHVASWTTSCLPTITSLWKMMARAE